MSEATMSREDEIRAIGERIREERSLMDRNGWTKGIIPIEWGELLLAENARLRRENEGNKGDRLEGICEKISESVLRGNQIDCDP